MGGTLLQLPQAVLALTGDYCSDSSGATHPHVAISLMTMGAVMGGTLLPPPLLAPHALNNDNDSSNHPTPPLNGDDYSDGGKATH